MIILLREHSGLRYTKTYCYWLGPIDRVSAVHNYRNPNGDRSIIEPHRLLPSRGDHNTQPYDHGRVAIRVAAPLQSIALRSGVFMFIIVSPIKSSCKTDVYNYVIITFPLAGVLRSLAVLRVGRDWNGNCCTTDVK